MALHNVEIVEVEKCERLSFEEERISGVLFPGDKWSSASVGFVAAGVSQRSHFHTRPKDGIEIIFIYAGRFCLISKGESSAAYDADANEPVFVRVPSSNELSISNIGTKEVRFFSIFVPPFAIGEIRYTE